MKNLKRTFAVILAALTLAVCCTACGDEQTPQTPKGNSSVSDAKDKATSTSSDVSKVDESSKEEPKSNPEESKIDSDVPKTNATLSGSCGAKLTYKLDDNGTLTISGNGEMGDYSYSYTPGADSHTTAPWDSQKGNIKKIVIESGVTSIGNYAFGYCTSLTSITIPNSVNSIGDDAFSGCKSLTSIEIPDSITSIGGGAFEYCKSLTSIEIPDSVTSIGGGAFADTAWYNNQLDGLVYAGKVLYKYKGDMPKNTSVEIKNGTSGITAFAFSDCANLTSVTIPDSVMSIGEGVFYGCTSLKSITIPNSVKSIGYGAFYGCTSLKSITIPDSVTEIESSAFYLCMNLTIYGTKGSAAEEYAKENNIKFVAE